MTIWQDMAATLADPALGLAMPAAWSRPSTGESGQAQVLPGRADTDTQLGNIRVDKNADWIKVPVDSTWVPTFGDQVELRGDTWLIRADPTLTRRGTFWRVKIVR